MSDERRGRAPRPPKPTPAQRREQRAASDDPAEVLDAAARFLEARPRSEDEVRRKLLRLGYRPEMVEEALARLLTVGYLDDEAFARSWVESRDRARPRGEHALRRELGLKGVERVLVDAVLGERRDDAALAAAADGDGAANPDETAAERLLTKKLGPILREPDPRRRLQRAYAMLARNGFAPDVCSTVAKRALAASAASVSDDDLGPEADA
ncbi:MAG: regulatory protein RecX [Candidatus Limnocylindrales bacterium]